MAEQLSTYINKEICAECGGKCCKENGCVYLPCDFKSMNYMKLKKQLLKGNISIDGIPIELSENSWTYVLILRARNENAEIVDLFTSGGPCKMLKEDGCFYDEETRPSCGKAVKPIKPKGPCKRDFDEYLIFDKWVKYQSTLEMLLKDFTGKEFKDYLFELAPKKLDEFRAKRNSGKLLTPLEYINYHEIVKTMANKNYYTASEARQDVSMLYSKR